MKLTKDLESKHCDARGIRGRMDDFSRTIDQGRVGLYNEPMPLLERAERLLPIPFGLGPVAVGRERDTRRAETGPS